MGDHLFSDGSEFAKSRALDVGSKPHPPFSRPQIHTIHRVQMPQRTSHLNRDSARKMLGMAWPHPLGVHEGLQTLCVQGRHDPVVFPVDLKNIGNKPGFWTV